MRIQATPCGLLCCLVLCCASASIAQNVSNDVSADIAGNAALSSVASPEGALSNQVDENVSGAIGGSLITSAVSGSVASVASNAGARLTSVTANRDVQYVAISATVHGLNALQPSGRGRYPTAASKNISRAGAAKAGAGKIVAAAGGQSQVTIGAQENASYSENFPDSTKGTAMLNPPDPGTGSPLDWNPNLNFEFADMTQGQFLNPTLRVRGRVSKRNGQTRRLAKGTIPGHGTPSPASPSMEETLEPGILNQPASPSSSDESLIGVQ